MVIFGGDEEVAIKFSDFISPALRSFILGRCIGWRCGLLEERHRIIAEVDNPRVTLAGLVLLRRALL